MNYAFTVTKAGDEITPIEKITAWDYKRIWKLWEKNNIKIIYKFEHHDSETKVRHVHFHGMLTTPTTLKYSKLMVDGFSIQFDNMQMSKKNKDGSVMTIQEHYDKVISYCMHEITSELKSLRETKGTIEAQDLLEKVMDAGQPMKQSKIKIKKSNALFKLEIFTNI